MKKILSIILTLCFLLSLTACGTVSSKQPPFDKKTVMSPLSDNLIAENDTYTLEWDEVNYGVILTNKLTGEVWGTSPKESDEVKLDSFGMPIKRHDMTNSVLSVYYRDKKVGTDNNNVYSYNGVVENGHVRCAKIKNGVHVEYYFDSLEFMIPVDFVLCEDYVSVSIKTRLIQENSNIVTSVSLAPFFCSVENDTKDAYLFVPSGSGAIINTKTESLQGNSFSAPVYGEDLAQKFLYNSQKETAVRMPVFGVNAVESGVFGVIEGAEETALIESISGSESYGFSAVYPTFQLRGYTEHQSKVFSSTIRTNIIYSELVITEEPQVRYYPLSKGKTSYSAMAETYREYLKEKGFLENSTETIPLNIELIGGSLITESFLGIPYTTVQPTTTIEQASDIINDLSSYAGNNFTVKLNGFGSTGIDIGSLAGGFTVDGNIGSKSQLKELASFCKKKNIGLFMDFDIVRFSESANGFSTFFDNASNAGDEKVSCYVYDKATGLQERSKIYYILSPWKFDDVAEKLIDKTEKFGLGGISLETFSSLSYSDYSEKDSAKYYSKAGFSDAVSQAMKKIGKGQSIMASSANDYAAVQADLIVDTPTASENNIIFSADVPFYQMVFKGYIPMFTESVNLAKDPETMLLKAVEGGCGLSYTAISKWDNSLIDSDYNYFHSSVYSDLKAVISQNIQRLSSYYEKIANAHIVSNKIINDNVRVTEFDNGIMVYVNYGDTQFKTSDVLVAPKDYLIKEGV